MVGLLSVLAAVLVGLQTFLRYAELAEKHRLAGARFSNLKHEIELLAAFPPTDQSGLRAALAQLEERWSKLREESPTLPSRIWRRIEQSLRFEMHEERYPHLGKNA
jgi:hypothetical protein